MSPLIVIDPGAKGGFVIHSGRSLTATPFKGVAQADHVLASLAREIQPQAVIELVHASPVMGPASAFSFGGNYHAWLALCLAHKIPVNLVSPTEWQRKLSPEISRIAAEIAGRRGRPTDKDRKQALNAIAKDMYPSLRPTEATCDAILLADYVMTTRSETGKCPGKLLDFDTL